MGVCLDSHPVGPGRMREQGQGGRIICIGSWTGQGGNFGQTNYAAAKAGIVGMVRTWALGRPRWSADSHEEVGVRPLKATMSAGLLAAAVALAITALYHAAGLSLRGDLSILTQNADITADPWAVR